MALISKTPDTQRRGSPFCEPVSPWRAALRRLRRLPLCIGLAWALSLVLPHPVTAQDNNAQASNVQASNVQASNLGQTTSRRKRSLAEHDFLQVFYTGSYEDNYTLTSVEVGFGNVSLPDSVPALSIWTRYSQLHGTKVGDLTGPATLSANTVNTWTTDGIQLDPNRYYVILIDSDGSGSGDQANFMLETDSLSDDATTSPGWLIHDASYYNWRDDDGRTHWGDWRSPLKVRVKARENPAVAPAVSSIVRRGSSHTNVDSLVWRVTFSKEVTHVDATDFTIDGTTATLRVSGQKDAYNVTLSGGDLASLDGPVTLGFASGQNIQDTGGRALSSTTPIGSNDNTYVVDNTGPTILHIRRHAPAQEHTNVDPLTWRLTFSEPVVNLAAEDIFITSNKQLHISGSARDELRQVTDAVYEIRFAHMFRRHHYRKHSENYYFRHDSGIAHHWRVYSAFVAKNVTSYRTFNVRDMAGNPLTTPLPRPSELPTHAPAYEAESYRMDLDAPKFRAAVVNGDSLTLTYRKDLDTDSVPAADAFTVEAGGAQVSLAENSPVAVAGQRVTLTLASAVTPGQAVRVDYTAPGSNPIRDLAGNNAANLLNKSVTNATSIDRSATGGRGIEPRRRRRRHPRREPSQ